MEKNIFMQKKTKTKLEAVEYYQPIHIAKKKKKKKYTLETTPRVWLNIH